MRYLVLSDIHANIDALDAVLEDAGSQSADAVLVLGDLVGYGAEPEMAIDRVRSLAPVAIVRGNHDKVVAGLEGDEGFNPMARRSAAWTRQAISEDSLAYLAALPQGPLAVDPLVEICHGSPYDEDWYISGETDALEALSAASRPVCFFGHTHIPLAAECAASGALRILFTGTGDRERVALTEAGRYLVNPGSVGQPRDGDPRAAYGILDTEARDIVVRRVAYPVERARDRILATDLPKQLAQRLMLGR